MRQVIAEQQMSVVWAIVCGVLVLGLTITAVVSFASDDYNSRDLGFWVALLAGIAAILLCVFINAAAMMSRVPEYYAIKMLLTLYQ